jgi:hypothetical protein
LAGADRHRNAERTGGGAGRDDAGPVAGVRDIKDEDTMIRY